jgi:hypothetical protein
MMSPEKVTLRQSHKRSSTITKASEPQLPSQLPLPVLFHANTGIVISTEAARALREQRSGEIRFSPASTSKPLQRFCLGLSCCFRFFSAFSAQKSHVKPLNHLTQSK